MPSTHQPRNCPTCARTEFQPHLEKGGLTLVRCLGCSMVYADPVPQDLASGEYYDQTAARYYLSPDKLASDYAPARFERELRLLRRHCEGGTVLDVGCSTGAFLYELNRRFPRCYETCGTDVAAAALGCDESKGGKGMRGNFLDRDIPEVRFYVVTFWAVIEHLAEPKICLHKAEQLHK